MKKLSKYNAILLLKGARMTGSFRGALVHGFEDFYVKDYEKIKEFAYWLDDEVGGASSSNIFWLFDAFKNPENEILKRMKDKHKEQIQRLKNLLAK